MPRPDSTTAFTSSEVENFRIIPNINSPSATSDYSCQMYLKKPSLARLSALYVSPSLPFPVPEIPDFLDHGSSSPPV